MIGGRLVLGLVVGLAGAAVVGGAVGLPFAITHREASPIEVAYAQSAISVVSALRATSGAVQVGDQRSVETGRAAYVVSCAQCHGDTGSGQGRFGLLTFPPAADLRSSHTRTLSDAQLHGIIKHGLGFNAMPAYARVYNDADVSAIVSYLRSLQQT